MNKRKQAFRVFAMLSIFGLFAVVPVLTIAGLTSSTRRDVGFQDVSGLLAFVRSSEGGDGLAGAAWFDYNNDGFLDLYLANGKGHGNGLFQNNGDGTFTDVSAQAGVENGLGNSGVIAGDIDNDGHVDIFLTGEGGLTVSDQSPTKLFYNNGDGTFSDITIQSGVVGAETAISAAFADIDKDGFLDLFIASPGSLLTKTQHKNKLYHNNGDRTFTDISASAGVDTDIGACAVGFCDYDNDGWLDLFVVNCNDVFFKPVPIELFRNNGDLTFTDVAREAGLRRVGAWMGITFGDYDNDGDMDFFVTNAGVSVPLGSHALYRNNGNGTFTFVSFRTGVARWEWGWGCSFADFDNDGYLDLFFAGSFPPPPLEIVGSGIGNPGRLFMNIRGRTFKEIGSELGFNLSDQFTSGVAVGDFDSNGFADIVVGVNTFEDQIGRTKLFQNIGNDNSWLTIKTVGTVSNHDGIGARVKVAVGDHTQTKDVHAGSSFLSMDSPWLTFGLAEHERVDMIEITWPLGLVERFLDVPARQVITLVEGEGVISP